MKLQEIAAGVRTMSAIAFLIALPTSTFAMYVISLGLPISLMDIGSLGLFSLTLYGAIALSALLARVLSSITVYFVIALAVFRILKRLDEVAKRYKGASKKAQMKYEAIGASLIKKTNDGIANGPLDMIVGGIGFVFFFNWIFVGSTWNFFTLLFFLGFFSLFWLMQHISTNAPDLALIMPTDLFREQSPDQNKMRDAEFLSFIIKVSGNNLGPILARVRLPTGFGIFLFSANQIIQEIGNREIAKFAVLLAVIMVVSVVAKARVEKSGEYYTVETEDLNFCGRLVMQVSDGYFFFTREDRSSWYLVSRSRLKSVASSGDEPKKCSAIVEHE